MQMKQVIEQRNAMNYQTQRESADDPDQVKFQKITIDGENYEVKGSAAMISALIGHLRLVAFAFLFAGDMIFNAVGGISTMPDAVKDTHNWIQENKLQFGIGVFFISSMIQNNMLQSGAFEVYINGNLEYSKLEMKRMPDFDAL